MSNSYFRVARIIALSCMLLSVSLTVSQAFGQEEDEDKSELVKQRVDEVKSMLEEERSTLNTLEEQLVTATAKEQEDQIQRLEEEVQSSRSRINKLKRLAERLNDLMTASEEGDEAKGPEESDGSPRAQVQGLNTREAKEREKSKARRRDRPRAQAAGMSGAKAEHERKKREAAGEEADAKSASDADRGKHLQDALEALEAAGEFALADQVQAMLDKEEAGKGMPVRAEEPLRKPSKRARSAAKRPAQAGVDDELKDMISSMRDEMEKLRNEVQELKDKDKEDDQ